MKLRQVLTGAALGALAAVSCQSPALADDTIVTITREPVAISRLGQSVTVLMAADIERLQTLTLVDLLPHAPGLHVIANGGPGAAAAVSVRGATSDQTLFVFDGITLNDPSQVGGGTNLGLIGTDELDRVEILSAPLSTLWGSGALGGVVSLTGRDATAPFEADLKAQGYDRYGALNAGIGGRSARLTWRVAASGYNDQGISAYAPGAEKDGFAQTHLSLRGAYTVNDRLTARVLGLKTHSRNEYDGYPPPLYGFGDTVEDFGKTDVTVIGAGVTHAFTRGEQVVSISSTQTRRRDFDAYGTSFEGDGDIGAGDYILRVSAGKTRWVIGGRLERSHMRVATPWSTDLSKSVSQSSLFVQASRAFGPLGVSLSLRQDDSSSFGGHTTAALGLNAPVSPTLTLRASLGQGYKAPSLYQLYSDYGDPSLTPEEALTAEIGAQWRFAVGQVDVAVFTRTSEDLIGFATCTTDPSAGLCPQRPYGYYANIDRAQASGLEIDYRLVLSATLSLSGHYSHLLTRNDSPGDEGKRLARAPRHSASLDLDWSPTPASWLGLSLRHTGRAFDDAANTRPLKAFTLIDLRGHWDLAEDVRLFGRVENAGDSRYETAAGYGSVGRRLWLGIHRSW